jgi:hypothetical protein
MMATANARDEHGGVDDEHGGVDDGERVLNDCCVSGLATGQHMRKEKMTEISTKSGSRPKCDSNV